MNKETIRKDRESVAEAGAALLVALQDYLSALLASGPAPVLQTRPHSCCNDDHFRPRSDSLIPMPASQPGIWGQFPNYHTGTSSMCSSQTKDPKSDPSSVQSIAHSCDSHRNF